MGRFAEKGIMIRTLGAIFIISFLFPVFAKVDPNDHIAKSQKSDAESTISEAYIQETTAWYNLGTQDVSSTKEQETVFLIPQNESAPTKGRGKSSGKSTKSAE